MMNRSASALQVLGTADCSEWLAVLKRARHYDFHHLPQYHRLSELRCEGDARFFVYSEGDHMIGLPLLLRPVHPEQPGEWQDATSVYGYGGPVASQESLPESIIRHFQVELAEALGERRVVSVFSRLHPLLPQREILAGIGECPVHGATLSIDLTLPEEEMRAHYSKSCRASLRKLRESGFLGVHDPEKRYLSEFVEVYLETMRRAGAHTSYLFGREYFDMLTRELGEALQLFVVVKDGEVAAATLCTICDGIVQDHLGGTRDAFLRHSPDRLVVDTARTWAAGMGAHTYHLGGGVGAREDSLFHYKSGFSHRRHTFSTFRWVLFPEVYEELSAQRAAQNAAKGVIPTSPDFFPAYRCG